DGFAEVLQRGQKEGSVRRDLDPRQAATFLVAAIEGSYGLAKSAQSPAMLRANLEFLVELLKCLRPARKTRRVGRAPKRDR
ncbi:MAG TPA: hypothetical protein VKB22_01665, partial [Gemmatimonadales bacterium]|nr:hypothetical protein [Gemmatimonadales bacterium]